MPVTVIQHEEQEGAGTLAPLLRDARYVHTWRGDAVPGDAEALVVLGGGMGAYEQERLPFLRDEIRLLRRCVEEKRPVLGICLGSQLLAAALGATVAKAPQKELGFYRVRIDAQGDKLFGEAPRDFVAFHWHGDAFTLPPDAVPLASSTLTPLQAFRSGTAWGVQFHLEMNLQVLEAMIRGGREELEEAGVDAELLREQARRELPRMQDLAAPVFARWTALL